MSRNRKAALALVVLVLIGAASAFWMNRVPEPQYKGVKLGFYLTNGVINWQQAFDTLSGLGPQAVPYLVNEMTPRPGYHLLFKFAPRLPASVQNLLPDQRFYNARRGMAAYLLCRLDTDAIAALPAALRAVENKDSAVLSSCVHLIGQLAPGTPYEARAVDALITATDSPDSTTRRAALGWLQRVNPQYHQAIPVLVRKMYDAGMGETCMKSLLRFGTNALPALHKAAEEEKKGHIRLAEMTIEKIEQQAKAGSPNSVTLNR